jgi:hypothetical protein
VKFPLGGIKVSNIDWVELELHIQSYMVNDNQNGPPSPFPNIGLGDTLVVPIEDYGRSPSIVSYDSTAIGSSVVLIPAGDPVGTGEWNPTVSADVTDAVIAAKTAKSRFVTFRIQTAVDTINPGKTDRWFFASSETVKSYRPRIIVHLN